MLLKPSTLYMVHLYRSLFVTFRAWKKIYNSAAHLARFLRSTHSLIESQLTVGRKERGGVI